MAGFITAKNSPEFARGLDSLRADRKVLEGLSDAIESKQ
jgi:hypothetical protein